MISRKSRRPVIELLESRQLLSVQPILSQYPSVIVPVSHATVLSPAATVAAVGQAATDSVYFGNATSEAAHGLTAAQSDVITGGLNQTARRLLPNATVSELGGSITMRLAVDPVQRNYFTVKLWGSDDVDQGMGRLYLYVPINGVTYQVGYRHEGDYAPLDVTAGHQPLPGRFFYSTTLLPLWITQGKTSLTLTIQSTGELYGLGGGGNQNAGGNYQMNMDTPSRGIYAVYTHTQPMLDVSGEVQGGAPAATTRPAVSDASILGPTGTYTLGLKNWVLGKVTAAVNTFTTSDVQLLANSYSISAFGWTDAQKTSIVNKVVAAIDGFTGDYYTNPSTSVTGSSGYGGAGGNEVWGGRFGPLGWAIHLLSGVSGFTAQLDTTANYGSVGGNRSRRQAWGDMLLASRDYGRFTRDNRYLTNQSILNDINIYKANRGLEDLGSASAFTETAAERYLKESAGILPWLGSDLPGGGSSLKYGSNYYQVTSDGLTREWGYAGGYSEMAVHVAMFYKWTGDTAFRDQAVTMQKAIAYLRRPSVELSGGNTYRDFERVGLLAWRGVREADGYYANEIAYGGQAPWSSGMIVAGATLDPTAIGYAKQMLADNEYLNNLVADGRYYQNPTFDALYAFEPFSDYYAVLNAADSGIRLPTTAGQPDFVWSDETDGLTVVKHGSDTLWVEPYWMAKTGTGMNGIGRFYYSTPTYEQYGDLETSPKFTSDGSYFMRPNLVDMPERNGYTPIDNPTQAYAGEQLPIAASPDDSSDDTPYRGKADFYAFRFGNYLFGLNATSSTTYTLKTPVGFSSATDLSTGTIKSGTVTVAPNSTAVLYLDTNSDAAPVPTTPLLLRASGSNSGVTLNWTAASGATSYVVKRAATKAGTYAVIATGVTGTSYLDTSAIAGSTYHYVVSAVNANGESYNSMDADASAGLLGGWSNADLGSVTLAGSTTYQDGRFTVVGSGSDIGGTADSGQFAYNTMTGDGTYTARLTSATSTNGIDKVGLMLRASTAAGAQSFAVLLDLQSDTARTAARASSGAGTTWTNGSGYQSTPAWFRVVRSGNLFAGYVSADGSAWTSVGSASISMGTTVLTGMVVSSRYSQQTSASTFDNISLPGWTAVTQPAAPATLTAAATNATQVDLAWSAVPGASSYFVMRSTTAGGPYTTIASGVTVTSFSDTSVSTGTKYYYVVSALSAGGEGAYATEVSATPAVQLPAAPSNLAAAVVSSSQINLTWKDNATNETGFVLDRATNSAFTSGLVSTSLGANSTSRSVTALAANTVYYFRIRATNAAGNSAYSPVVSARTKVATVTYQAESAAIGGGTSIDKTYAGFAGTGYANLPTKNGYVDFAVTTPLASSYTLTFRYALGASASRTAALSVNGKAVSGGATFKTTGAWTTWATLTLTVTLPAGTNHIRLTTTGQDAGNIDSLTVAPA